MHMGKITWKDRIAWWIERVLCRHVYHAFKVVNFDEPGKDFFIVSCQGCTLSFEAEEAREGSIL